MKAISHFVQLTLKRHVCVAWVACLFALTSPAVVAQKATLIAGQVEQLPLDPADSAWSEADVLEAPLAPQAVVKPRVYETGINGLKVRALYDDQHLALHIEWQDAGPDTMQGAAGAFRDAVAVEFPADPDAGIPFFGMGQPDKPVILYQWKADWQEGIGHDADEQYPHMAVDWYPFSGREAGQLAEGTDYGEDGAVQALNTAWAAGSLLADPTVQLKHAVEKLIAKGFGTISSVPAPEQDGAGHGQWQDGAWRAVVVIPRDQDQFRFEAGQTIPVAFAAWDGSRRERGGEKGVSTWYFLSLEQPVGAWALFSPLLVLIAALLVELAWLKWLRRRATGAPAADSHSSANGLPGA